MAKPEPNATPVPPRNLAESGFDEDESDAVKAVRYGLGMSELHHSPDNGVPSRLLPRIAIFPCQRRDALWFIAW
jgi:hypothetical protein